MYASTNHLIYSLRDKILPINTDPHILVLHQQSSHSLLQTLSLSHIISVMTLLTMGDSHWGTRDNIAAFVSFFYSYTLFILLVMLCSYYLILHLYIINSGYQNIKNPVSQLPGSRPIYRTISGIHRFRTCYKDLQLHNRFKVHTCHVGKVETRDPYISPTNRWMYRHARGCVHVTGSPCRR